VVDAPDIRPAFLLGLLQHLSNSLACYRGSIFTFFLEHSTAIADALHSYRFCTMGAAVEGSICLYTMPNDLAAAVLTGRSKSGDGAFKAVEHVRPASHEHLKGLIVLVAAHFTLCHHMIPFL
jgi:hypothetical protein